MKKIIFLKLSVGILVLFVPVIFAASSYRMVPGNETIINEYGIQKKVKNNCPSDIFVPTNTTAEWQAFINNTPACGQITNVNPVDGVCGSDHHKYFPIEHSPPPPSRFVKGPSYYQFMQCWRSLISQR